MTLPGASTEELHLTRRQDRRALVDEAREKHYQDVPFGTSALIGAGLGATIPVALALHGDEQLDWRHTGGNAALGALLGAVSGVGVEGVNRLLTRTVGPEFKPGRWHRDQDPHRWNSLVRTAPLGVSLLGSKLLLPYLLDKKQGSIGRLAARLAGYPRGMVSSPRWYSMIKARRAASVFMDPGLATSGAYSSRTPQGVEGAVQRVYNTVRDNDGMLMAGAIPKAMQRLPRPVLEDIIAHGTLMPANSNPSLWFSRRGAGDLGTWRHELTHLYQQAAPTGLWRMFANSANNGVTALRELGAFTAQNRSFPQGIQQLADVAHKYVSPSSSAIANLPFRALSLLAKKQGSRFMRAAGEGALEAVLPRDKEDSDKEDSEKA
jgi:hypothetical protein